MILYYYNLNGKRMEALDVMIEKCIAADLEIKQAKIGVGWLKRQKGLILGGVATSSWRTYSQQLELVRSGASRTTLSNHRRGTAIDVYPDHNYINQIEPIMRKNDLVNDIGAWDRGHFNLFSNSEAAQYPIINSKTGIKRYVPGVDSNLLERLEGKYVQRVEAHGEVYKVKNGQLIYLKAKGGPLFDDWSRYLSSQGMLIGITEPTWDEIKGALI